MNETLIYLIRQTNDLRVTFGTSEDAKATCAALQEGTRSPLDLLSVVRCRNVKAAARLHRLLKDRYRLYQHGDWYVLPVEELDTLLFWFRAMATAVSTARPRSAHDGTEFPQKSHPRSKFNRAVAWLTEHDPECALPVRTVAERAGVSSGTAHNAARYLLSLKAPE